MMFKVAIYLWLTYCAALSQGHEERIIGGESADIQDYPYQISMQWSYGAGKSMHFCGGSILDASHVVTAAHCVEGKQKPDSMKNIRIRAGSSRTDAAGKGHELKSIAVHPGYRGASNTYLNDVAVLTLKTPIQFSKSQQPIKLPTRNAQSGASAIVTGWGITRRNAQQTPVNLQKASMKLLDSTECRRKLPFNLQSTQVCALQRNGIGVCSGDSGGPLVANGELVGIASYVRECGAGYPDVYTNVYSFVSFIKQALNK